MKVLQIHDFVAPGNSRSGIDMCRKLAERGHEVHVMAGVGDLGPADGAVIDGVTYHTYRYGEGLGPLAYLRYSRRSNRDVFERVVAAFEPDVLFFMQPLCSNAVLRTPLSRRFRRVYHFFSPWAVDWKINAETGRICDLAPFWNFLNMAYRRRLEGRALGSAGRVLCASRFMKQMLQSEHPEVPDERITILSGAVDVERFRPVNGKPRDERFTVFTMRRLVPRMGVDLLIRAVATLRGVRLIVGGDGPEAPALHALTASLGLQDRVEFVGYVPDEALPRLYSDADLVVLPTRQLEGFGLVLIEAMACGTPAMGTRVGGMPEVLEPLDAGLVIPEPTPEAIAVSIERFRGDEAWRRGLRERCRPFVLERFSWEKITPVLEGALS